MASRVRDDENRERGGRGMLIHMYRNDLDAFLKASPTRREASRLNGMNTTTSDRAEPELPRPESVCQGLLDERYAPQGPARRIGRDCPGGRPRRTIRRRRATNPRQIRSSAGGILGGGTLARDGSVTKTVTQRFEKDRF